MSLRDRWRSRRAGRLQRRTAGHRVLEALAEHRPDAFFVEVGAGDGVTVDHLRPFAARSGWRGIMVEPVPYVFERLRANYADVDGVSLENVAITDRGSPRAGPRPLPPARLALTRGATAQSGRA